MRQRIRVAPLVLVVALGLIAPACSDNVGDEQKLLGYLTQTEREPHQFQYQEKTAAGVATVVGAFEDDLKYTGTLKLADSEVTQVVVSDDALAFRIIDSSKIPDVQGFLSNVGSQIVSQALLSGQWVVDYRAAPPILAPVTSEGSIVTGQNPILDATYIFQYVRRSIEDGQGVIEFNPDAIEYKPKEDPFEHPDRDLGVKRYDLVAPPLPARSQRGSEEALPTVRQFRKMAFYVRANRIIKVAEQIDFEGHPDFRRARAGDGPKFHLELLEVVRAGKTREPIRVRSMSYEIIQSEQEISVELPLENALTASIGQLFGPSGLGLVRATASPPPAPPGGEATPAAPGGEPPPPPPAGDTPPPAPAG